MAQPTTETHPPTPVLPSGIGALPGPIAAFDVGGTAIKAGLVHPDGRITHRSASPTPKSDLDPAGAVITHVAERAARMPGPVGVGLVVPGIVDDARGIGVVSANLGWKNAEFRDPLAARTGLPVGFTHDVTAAAMAEARFGAAQEEATFAIIVIGTGIAAGLFVADSPHRGNGYAGEIGHTVIDPAGPACPCGAQGCLEQFASAAAIARRYNARSGNRATGAKDVLRAKARGDEIAAQVWDEAIYALAAGLRQLATSLAPGVIVIGGGLQLAGEELFAPLRAAVAETFTIYPVPSIVPARCGPDAGLLGSAIIGAQAVMG